MDAEVERTLKAADAMIARSSEVRNFFPQGRPIKSDFPGLILVHPFYFGLNNYNLKYYQHNQLTAPGTYISNMRFLLSDSDRNLFLFETYSKSDLTLKLLEMCRSLDGVYLIKTGTECSIPIHAGINGWKSMAERMLEASEVREFEFTGGQLMGDITKPAPKLNGCLGVAFAELSRNGITGKFKEGCCFDSYRYE